MTITKTLTIAAIAASFTLGTFGAVAQAQEAPSLEIDTAGVNFSDPAAVSRLTSRVESAAKRVCEVGLSGDLRTQMKARKCYSNAIAAATSQIGQRVATVGSQPKSQSLAINTTDPK